MKKILTKKLLVLACIPAFMQAMDIPKPATEFLYKGKSITTETLKAAAAEQFAAHPAEAAGIKTWAEKHKDELQIIIRNPGMNNRILPMECDSETPKHLVKISGILNRLFHLLHTHKAELTGDPYSGTRGMDGLTYGQRMLRKYYPTGLETKQRTFQTASSFATSLVLSELIKKEKWSDIQVPETFLSYIPGEPEEVDDKHCFVVQQIIPAAKPLDAYLRAGKAIKPETLDHAMQCTKVAALWDNPHRNVLVKEDGSLTFVDLEQPNNTNPDEVFHATNIGKYMSDAAIGFEEWEKLFMSHCTTPEKEEYLRIIKEHKDTHARARASFASSAK